MDYLRKFDIELEKEYYYAGERIQGWIVVDATDNIKVKGTRRHARSSGIHSDRRENDSISGPGIG